jgi:transposase-like protein
VGAVFPGAAWQRCRFHFSKNIADKAPGTYQAGIRQELTEMSDCKTLEEARQRKDRIVADYRDVADQAATCLDEGFESATGVMRLPAGLRPYMRTNNRLERLNREIKRRTRVIGVFPNTDAAVRMAGSVLIEQNDLQRCDRRQLDGTMAVRVPKLKGALFESAVIERYRRREESVEKALIDMYLAGVSTRRVDDISRALCRAGAYRRRPSRAS